MVDTVEVEASVAIVGDVATAIVAVGEVVVFVADGEAVEDTVRVIFGSRDVGLPVNDVGFARLAKGVGGEVKRFCVGGF